MNAQLIYSTPFFLASLAILVLALFALGQRHIPSVTYFILVCVFGAFWAASEGLLYLGLDIETNRVITYIQYLGISPLVPLTLIFTLSFFGHESWLSRTNVMLLSSIAVMVIVLVWTNPLHHMVFSNYYLIDSGPIPMLGLDHGPLWWGIIGYHYMITTLTFIILMVQVFTSSGLQRRQAGVILAAVCVVWAVNGIYVSGNSPLPNMDIGPLAFILVAFSMGWGIFRCQLLNILPIARSEIFRGLTNPILVVDEKKRVVDLNPAAGTLLNLALSDAIGRSVGDLLADHPQLTALFDNCQTREISLCLNGKERCFDLRLSVVRDKRGAVVGRIAFFHDSTERKHADQAQLESDRLQGVLEMAGAVSLDMRRPVRALFDYCDQILEGMPTDHPAYPKTLKLVEQAKRLKQRTQRLMSITRYETRDYLDKTIVDIDKASASPSANEPLNA